jgi:SAM-dependent methyltransferase
MTDETTDGARVDSRLAADLQKIYRRELPPEPWQHGGNLPWDDPEFSERMLAEHLDQTHGAASRPLLEIRAQVERMAKWLGLAPGNRLLDVTCGPGLYAAEFAHRGVAVAGIDFSPASIRYARTHCLGLSCEFTLGDVRQMDFTGRDYDAAIYLYGQFAVLPPDSAQDVLRRIHDALRPGGRILLEILDEAHYDQEDGNWWYTDQGGLWGDFPFLHLGERAWYSDQQVSVERYHILNLETGEMRVYTLSDQMYAVAGMSTLLAAAGFANIQTYPAWDGLPLKDAEEWMVYVAERADGR